MSVVAVASPTPAVASPMLGFAPRAVNTFEESIINAWRINPIDAYIATDAWAQVTYGFARSGVREVASVATDLLVYAGRAHYGPLGACDLIGNFLKEALADSDKALTKYRELLENRRLRAIEH